MSAEIVNLRRARKTKLRAAKEADAATNRARFGRAQSVRQAEAEAAARAARHLDGHRLGDDREETPTSGRAPGAPARGDDRLP